MGLKAAHWFLFMFLVPILQSIITSSGSSLSTRWSGSNLLSPSPSLEQKKRAVTSPSPCEYSSGLPSAGLTALWRTNTSEEEGLTHMETTQAVAWKDYKWEWLSKLFTRRSVLYIKEQQRGFFMLLWWGMFLHFFTNLNLSSYFQTQQWTHFREHQPHLPDHPGQRLRRPDAAEAALGGSGSMEEHVEAG